MMKVTSALSPSETLQCSLMNREELMLESMDPKENSVNVVVVNLDGSIVVAFMIVSS